VTTRGCICSRTARAWRPDGVCQTCGQRVLEEQLTPVILEILTGGTGLCLWRNNAGLNTHWPDGTKRKAPIAYGVATPGGADYIGLWSGTDPAAFVAVELKTPTGTHEPDQRAHGALVTRLNGIYAVVRSPDDAHALLSRLRAAAAGSHTTQDP
jgi:hypothetical protein